ncbi:unnamed protein product [Danaus chrysippus]|uniref:(African queen) hypothetical protein n=1 Tax=Danaus chrysippus TaxID=151541 RepID=A0A8J2QUN1_9NEOP|nr:unnamed protein product [Danaus chrysippus]
MSECRVHESILQSMKKVVCHYRDIIYVNDDKYEIADPITLYGDEVYKLNRSDGFKVSCSGVSKECYNIVGDGTPDALFPILSGMNDLQHPPAKRRYTNDVFLEIEPFIFHKAKINGFGPIRETFEGRIEERMAFMSIILPEKLKRNRKNALNYLKKNADVLTTPFDIHTTILDAMGLKQYASDYVARNSLMKRGLSLLEPISVLRTCADADILPYWCACMNSDWKDVPNNDTKFEEAGAALLSYVNRAIYDLRHLCAERELKLIRWVLINDKKDIETDKKIINYQAVIITKPGHGVFEGMMEYDIEKKLFEVKNDKDVSRISAYVTS